MRVLNTIFLIAVGIFLYSCAAPQQQQVDLESVNLPKSVSVPTDGSTPVSSNENLAGEIQQIKFTAYGQKFTVNTGQNVNLIYEGIDPDGSYLMYESIDGGYTIQLAKLEEPVSINFTRMCQTYIVANPKATTIELSPDLKYEQIIWTPRADGTWEVRVGSVNRGCKSEALDRLNSLRTKDYNNSVQKIKIK